MNEIKGPTLQNASFFHSIGMCRMWRFLAILRSFFHSSLLCTFSCHPSPPTILPSSLTPSYHLFLGLPLNLVVPKFISSLIKCYSLFKVLACSTTFFHLSLFYATFFQLRTFMLFISSKTSSSLLGELTCYRDVVWRFGILILM